MTPRISKFVLTAHITFSVGWLGAVAGFLVLSITSIISRNVEIVRGAYLSMNVLGLYAIVPLSLAALFTGLLQSLGTSWGLFRRYWTTVKFALTLGSVLLLLLHQLGAISRIAHITLSSPAGTFPGAGTTEMDLAIKAALAIAVLVVAATLSVYKPWGFTSYGQRIQQERSAQFSDAGTADGVVLSGSGSRSVHRLPLGLKIFLAVTVLLVLVIALFGHGGGHGLGHHSFAHHF